MNKFISLVLMSISLTGCFGGGSDNNSSSPPSGVPVMPTPTPIVDPTPTPSLTATPSPTANPTPAQATQFRLDQPTSAPISTCDGPYTLTSTDSDGGTVVLSSDTQISFSVDSSNMTIYADSGCSEALQADTQVTIPSGSFSAQFYVQDSSFESANVSVQSSLNDGQVFAVAMTPGITEQIIMNGDPNFNTSSSFACAGPFQIQATDFNGNSSADNISAGGDVDGFQIYSDSSCQTLLNGIITTAQLPNGMETSSSNFYIGIPNVNSSMTVHVTYFSNSNAVLEYMTQIVINFQSD
jgi:hypothetical protein